jgi:hypothetical protein
MGNIAAAMILVAIGAAVALSVGKYINQTDNATSSSLNSTVGAL